MKTCATACLIVGGLAFFAAVVCLLFAIAAAGKTGGGALMLVFNAAWFGLASLAFFSIAAALDGLAALLDVAERQLATTNRLAELAAADQEFQARQIQWLTHIAERLPPAP